MSNYIQNIIQRKRDEFDLLCLLQTLPKGALDGVLELRDIRYHDDHAPSHRMDLYRPEYRPEPLPVIINIHGGGLIMGSKSLNRPFCAELARLGYLVCSIEYQLVPEVTVFQQLEDIFDAMDYIDITIGQYGGEPGFVYMVGDCAGAFLAFYASALQCNSQLAQAAGITPSRLPIDKLALISGMFYTADYDRIGLLLADSFYGKGFRKSPFYPYLDPGCIEVCNSAAPSMLITSKADHYRKHTMRLSRVMDRHHIIHCLRDFGNNPSLTHAFPVYHPELSQSRQAIEDIGAFFQGEYDDLLEIK